MLVPRPRVAQTLSDFAFRLRGRTVVRRPAIAAGYPVRKCVPTEEVGFYREDGGDRELNNWTAR
jgi:hypothetical protein